MQTGFTGLVVWMMIFYLYQIRRKPAVWRIK